MTLKKDVFCQFDSELSGTRIMLLYSLDFNTMNHGGFTDILSVCVCVFGAE